MCKLAVEHQIRYTKRVDLPTDIAVQVVSLDLGGVVYPSQLNAKWGHHFQQNLPKYRSKTSPAGLGAHCWLLVLLQTTNFFQIEDPRPILVVCSQNQTLTNAFRCLRVGTLTGCPLRSNKD